MLYQSIYDKMTTIPRNNFFNKVIYKLLEILRNLCLKISDPVIQYSIGECTLNLPFSHELGIYKHLFPLYSLNIGKIAQFTKNKYTDLKLIDIGANIGDTIAIIKQKTDCDILAVEGDPFYFSLLKQNIKQFKNIKLENSFIGNKNENLSFNHFKREKGSAHVTLNEGIKSAIKTIGLAEIFKKNADFYSSKLLKIDTDGFDCKIIRGSIDWISKVKPIIFFEYDPQHLKRYNDDGISVFESLLSVGYKKMMIYANEGYFMYSVDLANKELITDIHNYFCRNIQPAYGDICAFHEEDIDLFENIQSRVIDDQARQ